MTPSGIARLMARRLVASIDCEPVQILEPSAGCGILLAATIEAILEKQERPSKIEALLFEQDARLIPLLNTLCEAIDTSCRLSGIDFNYRVKCEDFLLSEIALKGDPIDRLLVIANPPFFKLNKAADERAKLHSYAVHGQPNIYGLFMAATARLIGQYGQWCFIVPRSWMNGQYFKAVRQTMLRHLSISSLHVFESRHESFEQDEVLQETVIAWATGRFLIEAGASVLYTRSQGMSDLGDAIIKAVPVEKILTNDKYATVVLPTEETNIFEGWSATLETYGLKVSTGPVVAFRSKQFITAKPSRDTAPLLWLQHVGQQKINWPISKKTEYIRATAESAWMLVPNAPMIVMRRFSPKEDVRRVTCAPYLAQLPGDVIGLENHLNYIHRPRGGMTRNEVKGLAALLSSDVVDTQLRAIAGSTQINASELRALPLPPLEVIEKIGRRLPDHPSLKEIDEIVGSELHAFSQSRRAA